LYIILSILLDEALKVFVLSQIIIHPLQSSSKPTAMEKTDYMAHSEDVETGGKAERRRSSLTAGDIKHGDRALNLIGDERVELTDEDVRVLQWR
jgi:hypothetical protein